MTGMMSSILGKGLALLFFVDSGREMGEIWQVENCGHKTRRTRARVE
jgi:hypothetical protein